jgi:hypothetical protein
VRTTDLPDTRHPRPWRALTYPERRRLEMDERRAALVGHGPLLAAVWQRLRDDLALGEEAVREGDFTSVRYPGIDAFDYLIGPDFAWLLALSDLSLAEGEMRALLLDRCPARCWRASPYRERTPPW